MQAFVFKLLILALKHQATQAALHHAVRLGTAAIIRHLRTRSLARHGAMR